MNQQETRVVNLTKSNYDVYIGRAGKGQDGYFGNPFLLGQHGNREEVLRLFEQYFFKRLDNDIEFRERVHQLKGKVLGCFCKPQLCHGDVIAHYLNSVEILPASSKPQSTISEEKAISSSSVKS